MKMIKVATALILGTVLCGSAMAEGSGGVGGNNGNGTTGATGSVNSNTNGAAGTGSMQSDGPKGTNTDPNPLILAPNGQPQSKSSTDAPVK